jgi:type IV pilus assembly protein PilB
VTPEQQKLFDYLVHNGIVEKSQLVSKQVILKEEMHEKGLASALGGIFGLHEEVIAQALCHTFGFPRQTVAVEIENAPGGLFTEDELHKSRFIPVFRSGMEITIAIVDPPSKELTQRIQKLTGSLVLYVGTTISDLKAALRRYKGTVDRLLSVPSRVALENFDLRSISREVSRKMSEEAGGVTIAQLADEILLQAAKRGASDIHVEPMSDEVMIRFRIDGVLQRVVSFHHELHAGLVSVLKSRSGMDMFERNIPQDGRMTLRFADREYDVRVSALPIADGEKLVLRLLGKTSMQLDLNGLGFSDANLELIRSLLRLPNGILLATGPTGSGKTTTLYAALNELRSIGKNITTIENPIEYKLPLVNQTQVETDRGLSFATVLRSVLRQDPNIILIGEIRDVETGRIATEAAMTGHLVLSTLHTNDSIGAIPRLVNIGIESFWVGTSMIGVIAQRLVRKLCPDCKEEYEPQAQELDARGLSGLPPHTTLFRAKGCTTCEGIGYKGRIAIHEILCITEEMRDVISSNLTTTNLRKIARATDFRDMYFDGLQKSLAGITSLEEVERVTVRII